MRIAIDIMLLLYKYKAGTARVDKEGHGGMNHAVRDLLYSITHVVEAGVQPVFVYDGPGKMNMKRGTHTTAPAHRPYTPAGASSLRTAKDIASEQDIGHLVHLSRELVDKMGCPRINAPAEAEAECAALEKAGLVDAVMSIDGDAFLFGARTLLRLKDSELRCKSRVIIVQVFQMEDLERASPPLTQRAMFALAIFAGGDYNKGLRHCGPDLALKIGQSKHAGLLWDIVKRGTWDRLPVWRSKLVDALKTDKNILGTRNAAVVASLDSSFPDLEVVKYYRREIWRNATVDAIEWDTELDVKILREFTRVHFDWKYRHYAVKFVRCTAPYLLARKLLHCIMSGQDGSRWLRCWTRTKEEGETKLARVEFDWPTMAPVDYLAEPIDNCHNGNQLKETVVKETTLWIPHWLVEMGCPTLFLQGQCSGKAKKRKSPPPTGVGTPSNKTPSERGRGRPPKPKHPTASNQCVATPESPSNRAPLQPIDTNRGVVIVKSQKLVPATALPTPKPTRGKTGLATRSSQVHAERKSQASNVPVIDLTGDD